MRDGVAHDHGLECLGRGWLWRVGKGNGWVDLVVAERPVVAHLAAVRRAFDVLDLQAALGLKAFDPIIGAAAFTNCTVSSLDREVLSPNGLAIL